MKIRYDVYLCRVCTEEGRSQVCSQSTGAVGRKKNSYTHEWRKVGGLYTFGFVEVAVPGNKDITIHKANKMASRVLLSFGVYCIATANLQ